MTNLEPENWLTYQGDQRHAVGRLMGPGRGVGYSTVDAARYDPEEGSGAPPGWAWCPGDVRGELEANHG